MSSHDVASRSATSSRRGRAGRPHDVVLERVLERSEELVDAFLQAISAEVATYTTPSDTVQFAAVRRAGRRYVGLSVAALARGGRLDEPAAEWLGRLGRDRAEHGIELHALLHAYQVALRLLWQFVLEEIERIAQEPSESTSLMTDLSRACMQLTSDVTAEISSSYAEVSEDSATSRERARHEVWDELLSGARGGAGFLRRRAEAAGFRLGEGHVVAVVALTVGAKHPGQAERVRIREALETALGRTTEAIVGPRDDADVAIYPAALDLDESHVRRRVEAALAERGLDGLDHFAAVGRIEPGVEGIAASFEQATQTLQLARDCDVRSRTLAYLDSLPWLLLSESPELAADLWRATVEPLLRHDEQRGSQLVQTCQVVLDLGGNRAAAAKRLHVHRHTLAARLQRIEELTDCSFDDSDATLRLALGLRAHPLVAPDEPLG